MDSAPNGMAITARNLGKRYRIGALQERYKTLRESMMSAGSRLGRRQPKQEFWALQDVSFDVAEGEVLGIIGSNGAGKSTLLKILARITDPTTGTADIWGRVGSLLEIGSGFNQELSGRENVFLNGAILGMRRREIERKFDDIVEFAEVAKFIDTPVKRYSSGMYMRLAFAVAAHLEPDILLIDEVLAVGDSRFQQKCLGKMGEVANEGRTVFFVSHNMAAMKNLSQRVLWLEHGKVRQEGDPGEIITAYVRSGSDQHEGGPRRTIAEPTEPHGAHLAYCEVRQGDVPSADLLQGEGFSIELGVSVREPVRQLRVNVIFYDYMETRIASLDTRTAYGAAPAEPGLMVATVEVDSPPLMPGRYRVDVHVGSEHEEFQYVREAAVIGVVEQPVLYNGGIPHPQSGVVFIPHRWTLEQADDPDQWHPLEGDHLPLT